MICLHVLLIACLFCRCAILYCFAYAMSFAFIKYFGVNPGEWCDSWNATGVPHHWALGTGHRVSELRAVAELLDIEMVVI